MEDEEYDPSEQEIVEYCEWLGMDPHKEKALTWIAREALKAPLPECWKICYTEEREVYYFNMRSGESIWDHPMDAYYKSLFRQEKAKLDKKRQKMRLFSGSVPIIPLQDFFSDYDVEGGSPPEIPEALCDPIDFKLFVEPVVLPTSGRTVSKHTIVNNKWRDPFSREYVENRRLIHNVDKRHEVDSWLAASLKSFFDDFSFGDECQKWCSVQESPISSAVTSSPLYGTAAPTTLIDIAKGLASIFSVLPHLLDKEEEVCLDGQRRMLQWLHCAYALSSSVSQTVGKGTSPVKSKSSSLTKKVRGPSEVKTNREKKPTTNPDIIEFINSLPEPGDILGPILTMSTSASLEALCLIVSHHPNLRAHSCFMNFNAEVLNVLQLSERDIQIMAKQLSSYPFPHKTTNTDYLVKLQWCYIIRDSPSSIYILSKLPWDLGFPSIVSLISSLPANSHRSNTTCSMLRKLDGWPANIKNCDVAAVEWMIDLAISCTCQKQKVLLLYDVVVSYCGNAATQYIKKYKTSVVALLVEASTASKQDLETYSSALGSLFVHHDICKLEDLSASPLLQLRIGSGLLPRLTKLQWRPRHFESTVSTIIDLVNQHPDISWTTFDESRIEFLFKELSKKRKNNEDLRLKLEVVESTEKRLLQSYAINSWLLLASKLKKSKPNIERAINKKAEIQKERSANLASTLSILLIVRLKQKARRDAPPSQGNPPLPSPQPEKEPSDKKLVTKSKAPQRFSTPAGGSKPNKTVDCNSSLVFPPI
eukprot:TRINITY_DN3934_c0_g1_i3.p1 TRINITY_DN3934_c0_g1~~TRINITY_DN3934_c0_g1_i3.p1  ORF type:complete len:813 (+),score=151.85 TRINITY_DN3934_c0_g1_i3:157-2439(+)